MGTKLKTSSLRSTFPVQLGSKERTSHLRSKSQRKVQPLAADSHTRPTSRQPLVAGGRSSVGLQNQQADLQIQPAIAGSCAVLRPNWAVDSRLGPFTAVYGQLTSSRAKTRQKQLFWGQFGLFWGISGPKQGLFGQLWCRNRAEIKSFYVRKYKAN